MLMELTYIFRSLIQKTVSYRHLIHTMFQISRPIDFWEFFLNDSCCHFIPLLQKVVITNMRLGKKLCSISIRLTTELLSGHALNLFLPLKSYNIIQYQHYVCNISLICNICLN